MEEDDEDEDTEHGNAAPLPTTTTRMRTRGEDDDTKRVRGGEEIDEIKHACAIRSGRDNDTKYLII